MYGISFVNTHVWYLSVFYKEIDGRYFFFFLISQIISKLNVFLIFGSEY